MSLFSFKGETLGKLMQNPSDREAAVRNLAESVGGTLEAYYPMLREHDGCGIIDARDSISAASAAVAVAGTGAFTSLSMSCSRRLNSWKSSTKPSPSPATRHPERRPLDDGVGRHRLTRVVQMHDDDVPAAGTPSCRAGSEFL